MNVKLFEKIFFSSFVFLLGVWAFYEYRSTHKDELKKTEQSLFLKKDLESLKAFRIQRDNKKLEVFREDKTWYLKFPVKDLASWTEVSRWFDEIKNQKVQKVNLEEKINLKDYYLDKAAFVEMEFSKGEKLSFFVSNKSSFDGKYFIKKGEELFIGEVYFFSEVNNKDFDSFRSKKILPPLGHAKKIQFKGSEFFSLKWEDYSWSINESSKKNHKTLPLDSNRLNGFWTDLISMEAQSIKEAKSSSSLKKYHLQKPELELLFYYPEEKQAFTLKLSSLKDGKAFISLSHRDFIMEISEAQFQKIFLSKKDIFNHHFPFSYKKNLVWQIERQNREKHFVIQKTKEAWELIEGEKKTIDSKKVSELLDKIKNLKGDGYKKLDLMKTAKQSLTIKTENGDILFSLEEFDSSKRYSWVKTNLWEDLIAISKSDLNDVLSYEIFNKEKKPKARSDQ